MPIMIDVANLKQIGQATYIRHNKKVKIGRDDDNDLVIRESNISRHHAIITPTNNVIDIEDLDSRNGTFLFVKRQWIKVRKTHKIQLPVLMMLGTSSILRIRYRDPDSAITSEGESVSAMTACPIDLKRQKNCAIMVLDMCNSSGIANADEKMAYYLKLRLNQISLPILYIYDVDFVKGTGDGFLATFADSHNALRASIELATLVQARNNATKNLPISYRIALHYGLIIPDDLEMDAHGNNINVAFRVEGVKTEQFSTLKCQLPKSNRILCTDQFKRSLPKKVLFSDIEFNLCGTVKVKGISEEIVLFIVTT